MTDYDRFFLGILKLFFHVIKYFFVISWYGIRTVFTNRKKIIVLATGTGVLLGVNYLLTILYISNGLFNGWWKIYLFVYVFLLNGGLWDRIKNYVMNVKYEKLFESIHFVSTDNFYPRYIETTITENMKIITFYCNIPLSVWVKKQDLLESAFNARFHEIKDRPNDNRMIDIYILIKELSSMIPWNDDFISDGDVLNIGEGYFGTVGMNLIRQPHAFIAGETGSGKSIILQCMIYQALVKNYEVKLIDFKRGVSFSCFSGLIDIVIELEQANTLFAELIKEVNNRLDLFVDENVQDIKSYNQKMEKIGGKDLKRIIVVVDELAELVDCGGADKEEKAIIQAINKNLRTLARIARASGVHLLLGVQRPDSSIIDGQIKSNIPFRVCGRFADPQPSIIVLGDKRAVELPNIPGRFIADNQELQAYYFKEEQVKNLRSYYIHTEYSHSDSTKQDTSPKENRTEKPNNTTDMKTNESTTSNNKELNFDFSDMDL